MNFSDVDVRLGDRVFVVGPNASGKSNLLDVIRFLRDVSSPRVGGLHHAVSSRGGIKAIRCLAARRVSGVRVSVDIGMKDASGDGEPLWRYELVFSEDQRHRPVVERERVVHKGKTVLERPDDEDRADPDRLAQTHLEQIASNRRFRDLAKFFASARYLHVVPQLIRASGRSAGLDEDQFGRGFVERVANTHASTRKARLTRIQGALRVVVPQLKELELWQDENGRHRLRGRYEHWRYRGAWQTEERFSDGTLRLVGLLWSILEPGGPLLLEEPELSLNDGIVRELPQMFVRAGRKNRRQIIVSTHSAELLQDDGIGLDEVLLLRPGRDGTEVRFASDETDARALLAGGLSMADVVVPLTKPERVGQLALFGSG